MKNKLSHIAIVVLLTGLVSACGGGGATPAEMTAQALGQSISMTATAAASGGLNAQGELDAVVAQATAGAEALAATQAAEAGLNAEAVAATATAEAPIRAELPTYGIDPNDGHLAWIHPPASLTVSGPFQYDYVNQYLGTVVENFVISADITWYGVPGCGFSLRSDGKEDALSQYLVFITRFANGHTGFSTMLNGKMHNASESYANYDDPNFLVDDGATNRLTVVVRGNTLTVFTNGVQVQQIVAGDQPVLALPSVPVQPPAGASDDDVARFEQELAAHEKLVSRITGNFNANRAVLQAETPYFERGFVALVALNESGTHTCEFNNAWLWVMDK